MDNKENPETEQQEQEQHKANVLIIVVLVLVRAGSLRQCCNHPYRFVSSVFHPPIHYRPSPPLWVLLMVVEYQLPTWFPNALPLAAAGGSRAALVLLLLPWSLHVCAFSAPFLTTATDNREEQEEAQPPHGQST